MPLIPLILCVGLVSLFTVTALSPRALRGIAAELIAWAEGLEGFHDARSFARGYWRPRLAGVKPLDPTREASVSKWGAL